MTRRLLPLLAILLLPLGTAQAWDIKTTEGGLPIRWPDGEVVVDLGMGAESHGIAQRTGNEQSMAALSAWDAAMSGHLQITYAPAEQELLGTGRDGLNVIRWGTDAEDPFVDPEALGTTYLTYRPGTGQIVEADVVVNAVHYDWAVLDARGCQQRYDLQNILAHEAGHFFGVAHSSDHEESTMFPTAALCETSKRQLAEDDEQAASYLYDTLSLAVPTAPDPIAGCQSSGSGTGGLLAALAVLAVLGLLWPRRRERRAAGRRWMLWIALAWPALASTARASTLVYLGPAELAARADQVVEGEVLRQEVKLVRGWPMTVSTIAVRGCRARRCPSELTVSQAGGELGEIGLSVSGVHPLVPGSEVVLFLRQRQGLLRPVGMGQGVFRIHRKQGGEVLTRDLVGSSLAMPKDRSKTPLTSLSRTQFDQIFGAIVLK